MKKLFLLILFTISSLTSKSQYLKLPLDTNHYWNQTYSSFQIPYTFNCIYQLKVKKDTIINGKTYQKVTSTHVSCNPNPWGHNELAYLRDDTILKRIIILSNNVEKILYNFNKNVGDTASLWSCDPLASPSFSGYSTYTITTKDSIICSDGLYHKRFNNEMIEGVGSIKGLLTPHYCIAENYYHLDCLAQLSPSYNIIYSGVGTTCPNLTNIPVNSELEKNFTLFPNPTSDILNINTYGVIPELIEIKNILGQTIIILNNINKDFTTINIKNFVPGIYFVEMKLNHKNNLKYFVIN